MGYKKSIKVAAFLAVGIVVTYSFATFFEPYIGRILAGQVAAIPGFAAGLVAAHYV